MKGWIGCREPRVYLSCGFARADSSTRVDQRTRLCIRRKGCLWGSKIRVATTVDVCEVDCNQIENVDFEPIPSRKTSKRRHHRESSEAFQHTRHGRYVKARRCRTADTRNLYHNDHLCWTTSSTLLSSINNLSAIFCSLASAGKACSISMQ